MKRSIIHFLFSAVLLFHEAYSSDGGKATNDKQESMLLRSDKIYRYGAAIVNEEYKLIYICNPKTGSSVFKRLLRRMAGLPDLKKGENVHKTEFKYLKNYPIEEADKMIKDRKWTKAIFLRDPKERILSAFLDKIERNEEYFNANCCNNAGKCRGTYKNDFNYFVKNLSLDCRDFHWLPQDSFADDKFWQYINFVGDFQFLRRETRRLLHKVGGHEAWQKYGETGWGKNGNKAIFAERSVGPLTIAQTNASQFYTSELENIIEKRFAIDYELIEKYIRR